MCSIFGVVGMTHPLTQTNIQEAQHLMMNLRHRGPDAEDMRQCSAQTLLGSNRLRVTDAHNAAADMPMLSTKTGNTLVFNGEIYNHQAIRARLAEYEFKTHSDSEVVLAAYDQWGRDCVTAFNGMFALAIHDKAEDSVFLACDPTGQKSIYLYQDTDSLLFASEIEPLITTATRSKSWNISALQEFIAHRFIIGEESHINEIKKLTPGTTAVASPNSPSGLAKQRFYKVPIGDQSNQDQEQAKQKILQAVGAGCLDTFELEVPHALLLSGGIDSSAVLALAVQAELSPQTYSIGFRNDLASTASDASSAGTLASTSLYDEFEFSDQMAQTYATDHHKTVLDASEYCDYLDKWATYSGEPLGSQEGPCLVKLFESIQNDVKVAFTGSGPDELFDGYSYGKIMQQQQVGLADLSREYAHSFTWSGNVDLQKLMPRQDYSANLARKYDDILHLYQDKVDNVLQAVQLLHFHGRLAAYEFRQVDVISMRHSIEARSPLINLNIVKSAFDFEPALKQLNGSEKGIYKDSLRSVVPAYIVDRQKKGFPIPSELWFSKAFESRAKIIFNQDSMINKLKLVDMEYLHELWNSQDPTDRNIFSRLYILEKILRRQAEFVTTAVDTLQLAS